MFNRMRGWGRHVTARRNWLRMIYLTNCSVAVLVILIYLFDLRLPSVASITILGPAAIVAAYGVFFLIWFLVESFGFVDAERTPVLYHLYPNAGLRWYDLGLAAFAAYVLWLTWKVGFANEALWALGGIALANGLIGALQLRRRYTTETLAAAAPTPVNTTDVGPDAETGPNDGAVNTG